MRKNNKHSKLHLFNAFDCLSLISLQINQCNYFHYILVCIKRLSFLVVVVLLILMNYIFKYLVCDDDIWQNFHHICIHVNITVNVHFDWLDCGCVTTELVCRSYSSCMYPDFAPVAHLQKRGLVLCRCQHWNCIGCWTYHYRQAAPWACDVH